MPRWFWNYWAEFWISIGQLIGMTGNFIAFAIGILVSVRIYERVVPDRIKLLRSHGMDAVYPSVSTAKKVAMCIICFLIFAVITLALASAIPYIGIGITKGAVSGSGSISD